MTIRSVPSSDAHIVSPATQSLRNFLLKYVSQHMYDVYMTVCSCVCVSDCMFKCVCGCMSMCVLLYSMCACM